MRSLNWEDMLRLEVAHRRALHGPKLAGTVVALVTDHHGRVRCTVLDMDDGPADVLAEYEDVLWWHVVQFAEDAREGIADVWTHDTSESAKAVRGLVKDLEEMLADGLPPRPVAAANTHPEKGPPAQATPVHARLNDQAEHRAPVDSRGANAGETLGSGDRATVAGEGGAHPPTFSPVDRSRAAAIDALIEGLQAEWAALSVVRAGAWLRKRAMVALLADGAWLDLPNNGCASIMHRSAVVRVDEGEAQQLVSMLQDLEAAGQAVGLRVRGQVAGPSDPPGCGGLGYAATAVEQLNLLLAEMEEAAR